MTRLMAIVIMLVLTLGLAGLTSAQADPVAPATVVSPGVNVWVGLGMNPEFGKMEELRFGYEGLLPDLELAVGVAHFDGIGSDDPAWAGRAMALYHALDANMVASFFNNKFALPAGDIYGGGFLQYLDIGSHQFSGGYLIGVEVAWPKSWYTFVEYQADLWNRDEDSFAIVAGLQKKLR